MGAVSARAGAFRDVFSAWRPRRLQPPQEPCTLANLSVQPSFLLHHLVLGQWPGFGLDFLLPLPSCRCSGWRPLGGLDLYGRSTSNMQKPPRPFSFIPTPVPAFGRHSGWHFGAGPCRPSIHRRVRSQSSLSIILRKEARFVKNYIYFLLMHLGIQISDYIPARGVRTKDDRNPRVGAARVTERTAEATPSLAFSGIRSVTLAAPIGKMYHYRFTPGRNAWRPETLPNSSACTQTRSSG